MRSAKQWSEFLPEGFGIKVVCHSERSIEEARRLGLPDKTWNTYLLFSDRTRFSKDGTLCDPYVVPSPLVTRFWEDDSLLNGLSWNGGPTFFERVTVQTNPNAGSRRIEIGDDYAHLWDCEGGKYEMYDLEYMETQIRNVAKELIEKLNLKPLEVG